MHAAMNREMFGCREIRRTEGPRQMDSLVERRLEYCRYVKRSHSGLIDLVDWHTLTSYCQTLSKERNSARG